MNTPVPVSVLVVSGSGSDFALLADALREASGGPIKLVHAQSIEQVAELAARKPPDVILFDCPAAGADCPTQLFHLRQAAPRTPIVALGKLTDEDRAMGAVRAGAQDFLERNKVSGVAMMRALRFAVERHRALRTLEALTLLDDLTGLYNRRGLLTAGAQMLQLARRRGSGLWVLFADVDGLKAINDDHGHAAGDEALVEVGMVLRASFRGSDVIARSGGDEFVVLAIDAAPESRDLLLHRIRRNLERRAEENPRPFPIALTVGCSRYEPGEEADLPALLGRADKVLCEERRNRRGRAPSDRPAGPAAVGRGRSLPPTGRT
ncbi:MAG: diguanylate cyclase [Deltaproteobacteria bacterium]|nr:diguanylate cyclase [Deltaproteobacteria bacterium]